MNRGRTAGGSAGVPRSCLWKIGVPAVGLLVAQYGLPQTVRPGETAVSLLAAVQSALDHHPAELIQQLQVEVTRARKQQAEGVFDEVVIGGLTHSRPYNPLTPTERVLNGSSLSGLVSDTTTISASAQRLLRNGITVGPSYDLSRFLDNSSNIAGVNRSQLAFEIIYPLLRGRGRGVTTAPVTAAGMEQDATRLDLRYLQSVLVSNAATDYWALLAAQKALSVSLESEHRGETIKAAVQALIDADQQPRSDLNNTVANLSDRTAARIAAEQQLWDARQRLALDMGLELDNLHGDLTATEEFPDPQNLPAVVASPTEVQAFLDLALRRRSDYHAARARIGEAAVLRDASRNAVLPQLNLNLTTGYSGAAGGRALGTFFAANSSTVQGIDVIGGITYEFSRGNNIAKGRLAQSQAELSQSELKTKDLARSIGLAVSDDLKAIQNAALRVQTTHDTVRAFQAGLRAEQDKLTLGTGSVVNILTVEDRLTTSLQNEVQARLTYAVALVRFRFTTGTLLPSGAATLTINRNRFTTLPSDEE